MPEHEPAAVFDRAIRSVKAHATILALLGTVVGPASFTLVLVFRADFTSGPLFNGAIVLTLGIWTIGAAATVFGPKTPLSVMRDYDLCRDNLHQSQVRLDNVKKLLSVNAQRVTDVRHWLDLAAAYVADGKVDRQEFENGLDNVLTPLVRRPQDIFIEGQAGYWTASVYLYDVRDDALHAVARRTSAETNPARKGRVWPKGKGHVGFAFQQDRSLVVPDLTRSELTRNLQIPEPLHHPDDLHRYRCLAVVPLRASDGDVSLGCLAVTSARENSLSQEGDQEILDAAGAMAYILITLHVDTIAAIIDHQGEDRHHA